AGAGMVVFDVPATPGWQAEVDGRSAEVLTADVAFAAVWVGSGEHVVELRYRPPHLWWSSLVAILGLGAVLALARRPEGLAG
ncbi:MAG: YfhO family protein, partial [Ilumatobacter sp.]|nr:YfhO family protein [Ilumatobacter sp.]